MSMEYIKTFYNLKIKRGSKVKYKRNGEEKVGIITGTKNAYIRIRFDGEKKSKAFHPKDENLEYILEKDYGIGILVDNEIVAWFSEWTEEIREWCAYNYFSKWLTVKSTVPKIIPLTNEQWNTIKEDAKKVSEKLKEIECTVPHIDSLV